jgi:Dolichyl-phosphate-mannose-protein mannosyltransferase
MVWFERAEELLNKHIRTIGIVIALCGFSIRIYYASTYYLNPDEATHYTAAVLPWHGLGGLYFNAARILHPPLLIAILQPLLVVGHSEVLLRLVPAICGSLFPWVVMLWMQEIVGNAAALCAQLLLTFSPALIGLSAEVRAYTLAFLLFAIALLLLENSLVRGSKLSMIWSHVFLYLAILSEYSVAWFVAGAGVYALLRLRKRPASGGLWLVWATGQLLALGLYLFLYKTQIARFASSDLKGMYSTWLLFGFPYPHENVLRFALSGTLKQFVFMFQVPALALAAAATFVFGLYWLWRHKSPFYVVLMVTPFCATCFGAILHLFPYGPSRHTSILGIAIAATVGTSIAQLARSRVLPILAASPPCILIWVFLATHSYGMTDPFVIPPPRHQLKDMRAAVAFLHKNVQGDALILTDTQTDLMLGYYLGCPDFGFFDSLTSFQTFGFSDSPPSYQTDRCGNLRIVVDPTFRFDDLAEVQKGIAEINAKYGSGRMVWIAAGGFGDGISVANRVSDARPFGKVLAIYQESDLQN